MSVDVEQRNQSPKSSPNEPSKSPDRGARRPTQQQVQAASRIAQLVQTPILKKVL